MIKLQQNYSFTELDTQIFLAYFGGIEHSLSVQIYTKTAEIFLKNVERRLRTLGDELDKKDSDAALVVAHLLKGSLLTLGGTRLANIFRQIEVALASNLTDKSSRLLLECRPKLEHFTEELKEWIAILSHLELQ